MSKCESVIESFRTGFSCSQAVFSNFCEESGLEKEKGLKIAGAFGGGMAHTGEVCGAVTGSLMVIGLIYGKTEAEDNEAKEKTYRLVQNFIKRFKTMFSSINCTQLIGCDLSTDTGLQQARDENRFRNLCDVYVKNAVIMLEDILAEKR